TRCASCAPPIRAAVTTSITCSPHKRARHRTPAWMPLITRSRRADPAALSSVAYCEKMDRQFAHSALPLCHERDPPHRAAVRPALRGRACARSDQTAAAADTESAAASAGAGTGVPADGTGVPADGAGLAPDGTGVLADGAGLAAD